jgi:transposase
MLSAKYLVQDHEKCLWSGEALEAMQRCDIQLVRNYPKCSQDFNAIENCWKELRERLFETLPTRFETRDEFIARLNSAVHWLNKNRQNQLWNLCTNQKERASECLNVTNGGRTSW